MSRFDNEPIYRAVNHAAVDEGLKAFFVKVYTFMLVGLSLSGLVAYTLIQNPSVLMSISQGPMAYVAMFAPLAIVFFLSFRLTKLSAQAATLIFFGYSATMGVSLAFILSLFTASSVFHIFLVSASLFGTMSLYGYVTNKDLTSLGSFLMMGVFGLIIASLINMFLRNSAMDYLLSFLTVIIFTGLTAYDTQKIKEIYYEADGYEVSTKKAVIGALQLYIDFINIFISLLRLFGERK